MSVACVQTTCWIRCWRILLSTFLMKRSLSWRLGRDLQRMVVHTTATQTLTGDLSEWEVAKLEKIMLLVVRRPGSLQQQEGC